MSEAPERIWIDRGPRGGWMKRFERMPDSEHEYIRTDLVQFQIDAAVAAAYEDAAEMAKNCLANPEGEVLEDRQYAIEYRILALIPEKEKRDKVRVIKSNTKGVYE